MRIFALIAHDVRLQSRQGFYAVYAIVTCVWVALLRGLGEPWRGVVAPLVLWADPAALGFFFIGGLLLLALAAGSVLAFYATPARPAEVIASKVLTLTALSEVASLAIAAAAGAATRPGLLALGVAAAGAPFVLAGVAMAARFHTVNQYFAVSVVGMAPAVLGVVPVMMGSDAAGWLLTPSAGGLRLISAGCGVDLPAGHAVVALAGCAAWTVAAAVWAHRWTLRYTLGRVGGAR